MFELPQPDARNLELIEPSFLDDSSNLLSFESIVGNQEISQSLFLERFEWTAMVLTHIGHRINNLFATPRRVITPLTLFTIRVSDIVSVLLVELV